VHDDFVTPIVLQKVQPLFAVVAAMIVLRERPRPLYPVYFGVALVGTYLMAIPHPLHPQAHGLATSFYALGAALLWALGTVFGRYLARDMRFEHVTTLRFVFGLVGSGIALLVLGEPAFSSWHNSRWIALLALVTGLAAMFIYYYGLRWTPAVLATIAELAYPVTAILIGYFALGQSVHRWQWVGIALTSGVVVLLPARPRDAVDPTAAAAPQPA
jgi:drug/metabolite transporter (DMT)-like permease